MKRLVRRFGIAACCVALVGCGGDPLTLANYERVQTGMSQAEVEAILGKGEEMSSSSFGGSSGKSLVWKSKTDPTKNITLLFLNDRVQSKDQFGLK